MFAMKALALRNPKDRRDFQYLDLAEILNVRTVKDALEIIGRYYRELPPQRIATIAGVLDEIASGRR